MSAQAEYVLSHYIIAKILSMVAIHGHVKTVLDELLTEDGMSPVVFPLAKLVPALGIDESEKVVGNAFGTWSFQDIGDVAMDCRILLFGYKRRLDGELILNPQDKDVSHDWFVDDLVIGLHITAKQFKDGTFAPFRIWKKRHKTAKRVCKAANKAAIIRTISQGSMQRLDYASHRSDSPFSALSDAVDAITTPSSDFRSTPLGGDRVAAAPPPDGSTSNVTVVAPISPLKDDAKISVSAIDSPDKDDAKADLAPLSRVRYSTTKHARVIPVDASSDSPLGKEGASPRGP